MDEDGAAIRGFVDAVIEGDDVVRVEVLGGYLRALERVAGPLE